MNTIVVFLNSHHKIETMFALFKKELSSFFSSITGYLAILIFLIATGLFLWVIPSGNNILDSGFATLDGLFGLAPWLFLFLVPAITMRCFAEERKTGTLDLLLTRPLTETAIVLGKDLASLAIVIIAIVPTLIYFLSVSLLGNPAGNIDMGGTWGSYIGLALLAMVYVSIGGFCSSLTDNQVVAFLTAVVITFVFYIGFSLLGSMLGSVGVVITNLSIDTHYQSVSRGVVDTRDLVYFLCISAFFVMLTRLKLKSRIWKTKKNQDLTEFGILTAILLLIGILSSYFFARIDLTTDKRHSLSASTKQMLRQLDDEIYFRIYLDGELPSGFKRLQNSVREMLDEFRAYGGDNVQYEFIDPAENPNERARERIFRELYQKGLDPTNLQVKESDGSTSQKIIFPGIMVSYQGREVAVNILKNHVTASSEANLQASIQSLEYDLTFAINQLQTAQPPIIGFVRGHGELPPEQMEDMSYTLGKFYNLRQVDANAEILKTDSLGRLVYRLIVVAQPITRFAEQDKFFIDQYLMNGGSLLWLIDNTTASMDSLQTSRDVLAAQLDLNLDDQLFCYGIRLNSNLIQDMQCAVIPVNTALVGQPPKFAPAPWIFSPMITPLASHPMTKNLDMLRIDFACSVDTVGLDGNVRKTALLTTSKYSRLVPLPADIDLSIVGNSPQPEAFTQSNLQIGVLLEGSFRSAFANRPLKAEGFDQRQFLRQSQPARMIVVSDGDIIRNQFRQNGDQREPLPLGYDRFTGQTFGNKEFLLNAVNYLCGFDELMESRSKDVKMRMLDKPKILEQRHLWQTVNVVLPIVLMCCFGFVFNMIRKKKYA